MKAKVGMRIKEDILHPQVVALKETIAFQKRELRIEAALEKVRVIAMSMKQPADMLKICKTISQQLQTSGVKEIRNVQTAIIYQQRGTYMNYEYYAKHDKLLATEVSYTDHSMSRAFIKKMQSGPNEFFKRSVKGKKVQEWYHFQKKSTKQFADTYLLKAASLNYYWYSLGPVALGISTYEPLSKEEQELFVRFRNVFELSYRRFIDIEKAEAQAKEALIEVALEKVRSASLAMHHSDELEKVVAVLFNKLLELGLLFDGAFIFLFDKEKKNMQVWVTSKESTPAKINLPYDTDIVHNTIIKDVWTAIEKEDDIVNRSYTGKVKNDYYRYVIKHNEPVIPKTVKEIMLSAKNWTASFAAGKNSFVGIDSWTGRITSHEDFRIIKRFAKVFEQAYTRFLDLKKAETQAKENEIQLALERIRARTMAMHKSDELKEVISLVLSGIRTLNILAEHAGFYIDYKNNDDMHIWLADPNIEPFFAIIPYFETPTWNSFLEAKAKGIALHTDLLDFEEKNKFYKSLFKLFAIPEEAKQFYLQCKGLAVSTVLLDNVGLYIENFSGIPYTDEENKILMRFGKVFQQTYTRFLDLQKAEAQTLRAKQDLIEIKAARKKAEEALTELQSTQKQLIQAEKMASLGELTAGIAHEIQNPLNFVNNFSEVSSELISEMLDEVNKGNYEEVKAIAADVKQNLDKINHHGKRAGDIVKGMLQHSRTSSGQKELTDINSLCDEYLRLAYHGLRAKDKSFNAKFETEFNTTLPKINVVPQDIGRVILNLINNAFYAVNEKALSAVATTTAAKFEPTVTVSTQKQDDKAVIHVKDNGNGIPNSIKEKIFQPFFTTKPTGQGTGLGLSLSYDIIKAHGGEIKVETKENEGTIFCIVLSL